MSIFPCLWTYGSLVFGVISGKAAVRRLRE